jgi:hypothetical protein
VIDTVRLQWPDVQLGEGYMEWLKASYPMARHTSAAYSWDRPWEGVIFKDDVLGSVGTKSSSLGNFLWVERSLPKFLDSEDDDTGNCRQLSQEEACDALATLVETVEGRLGQFLTPSSYKAVRCNRVDFYYQREMPSAEVFTHIARCLKKQKGVALHVLSGVEVHQSREIHGRFYDKGIESGNERYVGVVRHEEQLRGKVARSLVDMQTLKIDPAVVRAQMNKRFQGWPAEVECYGFERMIEEHSYRGAAAALLCEAPQFEPVLRRAFSKDLFYKVQRLALEANRRKSKLDLRVPEGAWLTSGV